MTIPEEAFNQVQDELTRVRAQVTDLQKQLTDALAGKVPEQQVADPGTIWIETILSHRTKTGLVNLRWGNLSAQLSPAQTRQHAHHLLAVADGADLEGALYEFITQSGAPEEMAFGILAQWRRFREERNSQCPEKSPDETSMKS
jgi:endonuclease III